MRAKIAIILAEQLRPGVVLLWKTSIWDICFPELELNSPTKHLKLLVA